MSERPNDGALAAVRAALTAVAVDADRAPMAAYMRDRFVFLGVKTPARRRVTKPLVSSLLAGADGDQLVQFALACWDQPEREFQYVGADALARHHRLLQPCHLDDLAGFITWKPWWDTVDALTTGAVEPLVAAHPELVDVMDTWIDETDMWLARTAILHQLNEKERTDTDRLFRYCRRRAGDSEFFIRKAIGWALRQYARTDPDTVREFVETHRTELSALTIREATKHL